MTEAEQKKELYRERTKAVREARKNERKLVMEGKGTRDWTPEEQRDWIRNRRCKGYEGHHMKNVKDYPEYAGKANNIQFLNKDEHLQAHGGDFKNKTNGYYNPSTGKTKKYNDMPPQAPPAKPLSAPLSERSKKVNETKRLKAQRQNQSAKERAEAIRAKRMDNNKTEHKSKTLQREKTSGIKPSVPDRTRSKTLERERSTTPPRSKTSLHTHKSGHSEKH